MADKKIRIIVAKPGLDGHDRGAKLLCRIFAEAGMEVIAEYVQNAESMVLLGELGVDLAQGYFVGRPSEKPEHKSTPISLDARRGRNTINV